ILKNIYNEFVIYYDRLQSIELDNNRLLGIIAYKNIFPKDFNELQLGKGFVYTLFESKVEIVEQNIKTIDSKIEKLESDIKLTTKENLNSIEELDAVYLLGNYKIVNVAGKNITSFKTRASLIKAI